MNSSDVMVRFECGAENRQSQDYGPFPYAQLTYLALDTGDDKTIAFYNVNARWGWHCLLDDGDYSDVVIYGVGDTSEQPEQGGDL